MNRILRADRSRRTTAAVAAAGLAVAMLLAVAPAQADATQLPATSTPPTAPSPTDPAPTDPAPTDPGPTDPAPTDPAPPTTTPPPTDPAPPSPTTPSPTRTAPPVEGQPPRADVPTSTPAQVAARQREARRLAAQVEDQQAALDAARLAVDALATRYDEAMVAKEESETRRAAALAEQQLQRQRLEAARALVRLKRGELGRWASQAYRNGGDTGSVGSWMTLLDADATDDLAQTLQMIESVGRWRGSVVDTVAEAQEVQGDATARADSAGEAATAAAWQATLAAAGAGRLLEDQRLQIAVMTELLTSLTAQSGVVGGTTDASARARAAAAQLRLAARTGGAGNAVTGEVGTCAGADISAYPNGSVPVSSLCPLWAAPGQHLRADAAYAFQKLAEAYAITFGDPLCVTDSYRTLGEQVSLYATKPQLAALPGTSNHGWGTALDLCGGVQSFGTPQHIWMQQNAPLFGFFHPTWAQAGGSRPEPWHWEYAT